MPTGYSNPVNMAKSGKQMTADMAKQGGNVKDGVRPGYQDRGSELLPRNKLSRDRVSMMIISLSRDGDSVRGTTILCHASQTSRYSLGMGPRGSTTPACPYEREGGSMYESIKQTNKLRYIQEKPPETLF